MGSSPSIHDVNAERAERIAIVIQNRIFSNQSPFVEKMENVLWTHFARNEAQVHQLTVTTDAARLHSTQGCASEALMPGRRPRLCGPGPRLQVTRAVKVKVPGKHFSGLTPSEQKALYVRLRSVHEKRISLYFTVHSVMGRRPTLYFTVLSVMGRRPTPFTE